MKYLKWILACCFFAGFSPGPTNCTASEIKSAKLLYGAILHKKQKSQRKGLKFLFEFWKDRKRRFFLPTSLAKTVKNNRDFWLRQLISMEGFYKEFALDKNLKVILVIRKNRYYIFVCEKPYPLRTLMELIRLSEREFLFTFNSNQKITSGLTVIFTGYQFCRGGKIEQIHSELSKTHNIMLENLDLALNNLQLLRMAQYKSENLKKSARTFNKKSKDLNRSFCCCSIM